MMFLIAWHFYGFIGKQIQLYLNTYKQPSHYYFFYFIVVNGDMCENTLPENCQEFLQSSDLFVIDGIPTPEEIKKICP